MNTTNTTNMNESNEKNTNTNMNAGSDEKSNHCKSSIIAKFMLEGFDLDDIQDDVRKIMFETLPYEDSDEFWEWLGEQGVDRYYAYFFYQLSD
eukprot:COSAG05_NODE_9484_length_621_cov_1.183908_2_plen_92_part_01